MCTCVYRRAKNHIWGSRLQTRFCIYSQFFRNLEAVYFLLFMGKKKRLFRSLGCSSWQWDFCESLLVNQSSTRCSPLDFHSCSGALIQTPSRWQLQASCSEEKLLEERQRPHFSISELCGLINYDSKSLQILQNEPYQSRDWLLSHKYLATLSLISVAWFGA